NAGGTASNPQLWGALFNYIDKTNTDSAQNNHGSAVEIGMACGGTDSANNRRMLGMYLNKWLNTDTDPVCHLGVHIAANSGSYDYPLRFDCAFNIAAIDLRTAVRGTNAHTLWVADASDIALNAAAPAMIGWDAAVSAGAGGLHL